MISIKTVAALLFASNLIKAVKLSDEIDDDDKELDFYSWHMFDYDNDRRVTAKELFEHWDTNGDDKLTAEEIHTAMVEGLGEDATEYDMNHLLNIYDTEG